MSVLKAPEAVVRGSGTLGDWYIGALVCRAQGTVLDMEIWASVLFWGHEAEGERNSGKCAGGESCVLEHDSPQVQSQFRSQCLDQSVGQGLAASQEFSFPAVGRLTGSTGRIGEQPIPAHSG